jgi:hypothetical protein
VAVPVNEAPGYTSISTEPEPSAEEQVKLTSGAPTCAYAVGSGKKEKLKTRIRKMTFAFI